MPSTPPGPCASGIGRAAPAAKVFGSERPVLLAIDQKLPKDLRSAARDRCLASITQSAGVSAGITSAPVSGASTNVATRTVTSVAEGLTAEWTSP
jgi:hypothetical protein